MARKFIDFDNIFAQNERQPILARIKGEQFLFPAQMPAKVGLKIQKMEEEGIKENENFGYEQTVAMFSDLLGHDNFQKLIDLNVSFEELQIVLEGVMRAYSTEELEEVKDGEEQPKKEEAATETTETSKVTELRL